LACGKYKKKKTAVPMSENAIMRLLARNPGVKEVLGEKLGARLGENE
jgi:hypothetical protein